MAQAGDGQTVSRTRVSFCSGVFYGCNSLHGRVRVYAVAKTFFMQPRQHPPGYPGLLHLVVATPSTGYIATCCPDVREFEKFCCEIHIRYLVFKNPALIVPFGGSVQISLDSEG